MTCYKEDEPRIEFHHESLLLILAASWLSHCAAVPVSTVREASLRSKRRRMPPAALLPLPYVGTLNHPSLRARDSGPAALSPKPQAAGLSRSWPNMHVDAPHSSRKTPKAFVPHVHQRALRCTRRERESIPCRSPLGCTLRCVSSQLTSPWWWSTI